MYQISKIENKIFVKPLFWIQVVVSVIYLFSNA